VVVVVEVLIALQQDQVLLDKVLLVVLELLVTLTLEVEAVVQAQ